MAKDKKKAKKSGGKKAKSAKAGNATAAAAVKAVKDWSQNPMVADIVAAALVATASALKDTNAARRLAEDAGDELERLSKKGAERGNALWQLALDIGRRSLEEIAPRPSPPKSRAKTAKAPKRKASGK